MANETIGVYGSYDISNVVFPTSLPLPYPINIGSDTQSISVNNLSPYFVDIAMGADSLPYASIKPWSITPVNLSNIGTIYIRISKIYPSLSTANSFLNNNQQIFVVLSSEPNNSQMIDLSPTTSISGGLISTNTTINNASLDVKGGSPVSSTVFTDGMQTNGNWTITSGTPTFGTNGVTLNQVSTLMHAGNGTFEPMLGASGEQIPLQVEIDFTTPAVVASNIKVGMWKDDSNNYELRWQNDSNLVIYKNQAGVTSALIANNQAVSQVASTGYKLVLSLTTTGALTGQLEDAKGNVLSTITTNDTTFTNGFYISIGGDTNFVVTNSSATMGRSGLPILGDINIANASIDTKNIDAYISDNPMVYFGQSANVSVNNLANGSTMSLPDIVNVAAAGYFDKIYYMLYSKNGYKYSLQPNGGSGAYFNGLIPAGWLLNNEATNIITEIDGGGGGFIGANNQVFAGMLSTPTMFSDIATSLVNNTSTPTAVVNDALTEYNYAGQQAGQNIGQWNVDSGKIAANATGLQNVGTVEAALHYPNGSWGATNGVPVSVQVTCITSAAITSGIVVGTTALYYAQGSYYRAVLSPTQFYIEKCYQNTSTTLSSVAYTPAVNTHYTIYLSLDVNGNLVGKLYSGDNTSGAVLESLTATDTTMKGKFQIKLSFGPNVYLKTAIENAGIILSDTVTLTVYAIKARNVTQEQYITTSFDLGTYTFAAEVVSANGGKGTPKYTSSIALTNVKRVRIYFTSSGSGYVTGSNDAGIDFNLQVSPDGNTWYDYEGGNNDPSGAWNNVSGAVNGAFDSMFLPSMTFYPYMRLKLVQYNYTASNLTLSNSSVHVFGSYDQ